MVDDTAGRRRLAHRGKAGAVLAIGTARLVGRVVELLATVRRYQRLAVGRHQREQGRVDTGAAVAQLADALHRGTQGRHRVRELRALPGTRGTTELAQEHEEDDLA